MYWWRMIVRSLFEKWGGEGLLSFTTPHSLHPEIAFGTDGFDEDREPIVVSEWKGLFLMYFKPTYD